MVISEMPDTAAEPRLPWSRPWSRLRPVDRAALAVWAASRAVLLLLSLFERYATGTGRSSSWLGLWQHWDWYRYLTVAEYGYTSGKGPSYDENITAFLPGFPTVLRAVHLVVRDWAVSGLLISLVAGAVAVVALARLTEFEYARRRPEGSAAEAHRAARYAVLLLVCAPAAVFLAVGYTESLFLAFAVPGWLAARRGQWVRAGVLLAAACTIRINGLFVLAGVAVMFLAARPTRRDWTRAPALLLPLAAAGAYAAYLKDITGDWLEWLHAEKRGWSRSLTNPITAWRTSWNDAFGSRTGSGFGGGAGGGSGGGVTGGGGFPGGGNGNGNGGGGRPQFGGSGSGSFGGTGGGGFGGTGGAPGGQTGTGTAAGGHQLAGIGNFDAWAYRFELLAAVIGVATVFVLAGRRRWAELVYVGISVLALITSTSYMSIPREMLLWWPLWVGAAVWLATRRKALIAACAASGVLMVATALLYLSGQWAG
ncbi:hypothetical protein KDL01_21320 [Actinospica durhamensis]|uniref:Mannosyltransferase (PIG-V) n=1 Tax=Actinospica durhamensis TaxID=1508375 RepID=A0A941ITC1_9ACTN|nr:mannosyltransferase family protein [Actinospica durhamensis]MBR7835828.1 hypothetical protein [Actinospica durhamensis]